MRHLLCLRSVVLKPSCKRVLVFSLGVLTPLLLVGANAPKVTTGTWTRIAASGGARSGACAAALADGRVFINGGAGTAGALNSSEILGLDGAISSAAPMSSARTGHTCTLLVDGRVLVAGGANDAGTLSTAEIYDPGSNSWHAAGDMTNARASHTATRLKDGRVLIAGGEGPSAVYNTIEIFDPAANTFAFHSTGLLSSARKEHAAALLADGRVLIAGGTDGTKALDSTDFYDPRTETLAAGPSMRTARAGATATVLWDGTVLMAGGNDLGTAEIFDPGFGRFTETGKMTAARKGHLAFVLPNNNNVLLIGGDATGRSAELYIPWRGGFKPTGSLDQDRVEAVAAPMGSDGLLFLAGGRTKAGRGAVLDSTLAYRFATLKTDSESYAPGDTATLTGSGWQPGEKVTVSVHERSQAHSDGTLAVTADGSGNFEAQYQTAPVRDKNYSFTATGTISEAVAHASTGEAANLNQCADGPGLAFPLTTSNNGCTGGWVNGNVNGSKATYFEGDSLPYQTIITGLVPNTTNHTITIQWDTTQGNVHALDYITTYNRSVTFANECQGVTGCTTSPTTTFAIPADPRVVAAGVTPIPGNFTMLGGTIKSVSAYSYVGPANYSSSTSAGLTITFDASASTVVLAWGGHIATHVDWPGLSAVTLTGSPFHTRLQGLDGASVGNQDRALALSAAIFPFTIAITKDAESGGVRTTATSFSFTITTTGSTGSLTNPFTVCGTDLASCTQNSGDIFPAAGSTTFPSYEFTEGQVTGWNFPPGISCTTSGGLSGSGPIGAVSMGSVTFTPKQGDNVSCTYTNTASSKTVTLTKTVVPSSDTGNFTLTISPGDATCSNTVSGAGGSATCSEIVNSTVTVSESFVSGTSSANYTTSPAIACPGTTNFTLSTDGRSATFTMPNANVTCTVTNTRDKNKVTLAKSVVPSGDTGKFAMKIHGCASGTDATGSSVGDGGSISCDVYGSQSVTVSETLTANYTATNLVCPGAINLVVSSDKTSATFTMPDGAGVTCTLTNTRNGHTVTLAKTVLPAGDPGTFTGSISGCTGTNPTTGSIPPSISCTVTGGQSVTVGETANSNYTASLSCPGTNLPANSTNTGTFTMPDSNVTCTLTNTRNSHKVTLFKATVPTTDTGTFSLTISQTDYSKNTTTVDTGSKGNGESVSGSVTAGFTVNVSEVSNSNYTSSLSCGNGTSTTGLTLTSNTNTAGAFTMPDGDVTCTLTNTKNATLTIYKVCAPTTDTSTSFSISVSPTPPGNPTLAATCNDTLKGTGPIPLTPDATNGTTYTVSEVTPLPTNYTQPNLTAPFTIGTTGWTAPGSIACAGSAGNTVTLKPGDTATCFILNVSSVCTPSLPSGTSTTEGQQPAPAIRPAKPRAPRHPLQKR